MINKLKQWWKKQEWEAIVWSISQQQLQGKIIEYPVMIWLELTGRDIFEKEGREGLMKALGEMLDNVIHKLNQQILVLETPTENLYVDTGFAPFKYISLLEVPWYLIENKICINAADYVAVYDPMDWGHAEPEFLASETPVQIKNEDRIWQPGVGALLK